MPSKTQPLGICDLCLGPIRDWYTSKGRPRLYCSVDCRNTGNSRAGATIRSEKACERVRMGQWVNPALIHPPTPENIGAGVKQARLREVEAGAWRNPALDDEAREKLSRPRKHSGVLHSAIEKLSRRLSVSELTPEEQEAHRLYRRELRIARRDDVNRLARERYRRNKHKFS